jgi:hypothetical protein
MYRHVSSSARRDYLGPRGDPHLADAKVLIHICVVSRSLNGLNVHFGEIPNPAAPGRKTGGSSYGSAVAVASKEVSFALGVDSIGNCRVPAAYCGLYGFRPSFEKVHC